MTNSETRPFTWRWLSMGSALVVAVTLSSIANAGQNQKDQNICAGMGASQGSPTHTDCMLAQQQRRDNKTSDLLQQSLMYRELWRPTMEKLERKKERRAREKEYEQRRDGSNRQE